MPQRCHCMLRTWSWAAGSWSKHRFSTHSATRTEHTLQTSSSRIRRADAFVRSFKKWHTDIYKKTRYLTQKIYQEGFVRFLKRIFQHDSKCWKSLRCRVFPHGWQKSYTFLSTYSCGKLQALKRWYFNVEKVFIHMSTGFIHNFSEDEKTDFVRFRETFFKNPWNTQKEGILRPWAEYTEQISTPLHV